MPARQEFSIFGALKRLKALSGRRLSSWCLAACASVAVYASTATAQTSPAGDSRQSFVLSGTVTNAATGEPIPHALVRANGPTTRSAFSDSEGVFQFEGMPPGSVTLTAQKPGYYAEQDGAGMAWRSTQIGPNTGPQVVKLFPMASIAGRITDPAGVPLEQISVRLTGTALRDGHKTWESRGMTNTDDDGNYRVAGLMPGAYYISVGPAQSESRIMAQGEKPKTGYPHLYYPGVPELASASPMQLTAGQQGQADMAIAAVPVFSLSGLITGALPEHGTGLLIVTTSGDDVMLPMRLNAELGTFSIDSVPAGTYLLKAFSNAGQQQLRAEQRVNVAANLENLHLALGPAISIPVAVHMQSRAQTRSGPTPAWNEQRPPLSVLLQSNQPNGNTAFSTLESRPDGAGRTGLTLQNVEPGTYTVKLMPQGPWYVQSASYGQTNALTDDITVAPGQSYPLDVSLRDDSASVTATLRTTQSEPLPMTALVVAQGGGKSATHMGRGVGSVTVPGLAPGDYLVYAFDQVEGLEYGNADALAPYASQAAHVTVAANQQGQVKVDMIHAGSEP
jgi:protocatechuate 3,4-dioxygenase beta subunit